MLSAMFSLSQVNRSQGLLAEAVACAVEVVALAREYGDPAWLGWCLQRLGIERHGQGDLPAAETLFVEALDLFRTLGGQWGEAHTLHGLAAVVRDRGEILRAAALYGECLTIRLAIDERSGLVDVLVGLADSPRRWASRSGPPGCSARSTRCGTCSATRPSATPWSSPAGAGLRSAHGSAKLGLPRHGIEGRG